MELKAATAHQVVRNKRNGKFYRYVRPEGKRVRIRPLELFPNGLLQEKTTDTIVEADLEVELVGEWHDALYVQSKGGRGRASYERELERLKSEQVELEAEGERIDPKERGSHANKIKSVVDRMVVVKRGLDEQPDDTKLQKIATERAPKVVSMAGTTMQLPSGLPARVLGVSGAIASVQVKGTTVEVASSVLAPLDRMMATM